MICILTHKSSLGQEVANLLQERGVTFSLQSPKSRRSLDSLYGSEIQAAIVDSEFAHMHDHAWFDMLETLAQRIPVVVITDQEKKKFSDGGRNASSLAWLMNPKAEDIISFLESCHVAGLSSTKLGRKSIPIYNPQVPMHMLQTNGAISVLTVNATSFRKVAMEFGPDAYRKLQEVFQELLSKAWGASGSFRSNDVLVRKTSTSNIYYIFLEQSRITNSVPSPGILEKLADRLVVAMQNMLWNEIFTEKSKRRLPDCITVVPKFSIGHGTVLHNPCVDSGELIEHLLENSIEGSKVQLRRLEDRQKELLHNLIQSKDMLFPNFQAVFHLPSLTKELVDEVKKKKSILPIKDQIFGFESLIRVRKELFDQKMGEDSLFPLESRYLRPDIIFGLAQSVKVSLELDQVCMFLGITHAINLPGALMVNILPRNLYHIEKLQHLVRARAGIIFELSESEAVNNFELMNTIRSYLKRMNFRVAADDFGKGFASLERIIKIKPDIIKLDRSLVENIDKDPSKVAFVQGIVQAAKMAKSLILAEGVERWEEAETVKSLGVDLIQGFLLHMPSTYENVQKDLGELTPAVAKIDNVA